MKLSLEQIKAATDVCIPVYTGSKNYIVVKDSKGQYFIKSRCNDYYIGLTHTDNVTLNNYGDFFIETMTDTGGEPII